jgi:PAS domain S-box-containing protein
VSDPAGRASAPTARNAAFFEPFQRMPIPVHSMGPDLLLLEVNEAWEAYTGYARAAMVGRSFATLLVPESAHRYLEAAAPEMARAVPAREHRSVEYRLVKASGEAADIVLTACPERDPVDGRFLHSLAVITDVTARNRAEAALRQALKLEALGGLTSGVAHDFNNLLTVILGSLQMLSKRLPPDDARAARLVDAALEGARRGAALTSRLLAFSRQQELSPQPLDPAGLLIALRPMLAHLLGPTIRIEEALPPDLWTLRADRNQLELALLNLAANARDAMPNGGTLRIAARNVAVPASAASPFIGLHAQPVPPGDHVALSLTDTGAGMTEAVLARAADPFFTTKGPAKGTGLGLSMVHGFAQQSGGAMLLASRPGAGTTVELFLPRTTETVTEASSAGGPTATEPAARGLRILLVDDDPLVLAGTCGMLEELGHTCALAATSAEEALEALRRGEPFDLLLTDHVMPGMSGVQLATQARALRAELPILLASGFAELHEVQGLEWPRLRKPYTLADLSAAVAAFARCSAD